MMNVQSVLVSAFCLFLTFSSSCGGFADFAESSGFALGCGESAFFCSDSGGTSGGAGGRVSAGGGSSFSVLTSNMGDGSCLGAAGSGRCACPLASTALRETSESSVLMLSVGFATDVAAFLTSSRGFVKRVGLSDGVSGERGVSDVSGEAGATPPLPFACALAAARAAFSCCLFSRRACALALFIALFDGGAAGSVLNAVRQAAARYNWCSLTSLVMSRALRRPPPPSPRRSRCPAHPRLFLTRRRFASLVQTVCSWWWRG